MHPTSLKGGGGGGVLMQQQLYSRAETYYLTQGQPISSFQIWPAWGGSRGEAERRKWGQLTEEESKGLGWGGRSKNKKPSVCIGRSSSHSPCDHIGSEAEHEGANEGADLPRRSLPSPLLLLQATLADAGDTGGGVRVSGTHQSRASLRSHKGSCAWSWRTNHQRLKQLIHPKDILR